MEDFRKKKIKEWKRGGKNPNSEFYFFFFLV
jgi:hypothetical protein